MQLDAATERAISGYRTRQGPRVAAFAAERRGAGPRGSRHERTRVPGLESGVRVVSRRTDRHPSRMCRLRRPAPLREWARGSACLPSAGLQEVNNRTWRSSLSDADSARPPSQASAACNCSSKVSPSKSTVCSTSPEGPKTVIEVRAHASLTWACSHARGPALLMVLEVPLRVVAEFTAARAGCPDDGPRCDKCGCLRRGFGHHGPCGCDLLSRQGRCPVRPLRNEMAGVQRDFE